MSRVDDLVDLIQTANDVYLINTSRNVRMAYIQIDDLCELAMKSWLQMNVQGWSPVSHQHQGRDYYKNFRTVISEMKNAHPGNQPLSDLLDRFGDRRENRNRFFHNQNLAGLTVTDTECSKAFCDLYELMMHIFNPAYQACLSNNPVVRAQIMVIRLRLHSTSAGLVEDHYQRVLADSDAITLQSYSIGFEYHQICRDPGAFLDRVRAHFTSEIFELEQSINHIQGLTRPHRRHQGRLSRLQAARDTIQSAIDNCLTC